MIRLPHLDHALGGVGHNRFVALYVAVAAFTLTTLLTERDMWLDGRWLAYVLGCIAFAILARAAALQADRSRLGLGLLIGQSILLLGLFALSNYYFLTAMLSFITVSVAQSSLSPRAAILFDAVLLVSLVALLYAATGELDTIWQLGMGLGAGFVFMVVFTRVTDSEIQARYQLQQLNAQLAEYAAQVEQLATVRERNRLARDVHDSLGHYLTVINVQLEVVTKLFAADPDRALEAATRAKALASEGLAEVRRSVAALRPSPLDDRPLPDALRGLTEGMRDDGLLVSFSHSGVARTLSPEIETVLYRTAQESLTNIRKHAHASKADVQLAFEPESVHLRIRDNGLGARDATEGVGLRGLHERVAALSGSLRADNHPDGGFVIEIALPYAGAA